MLLELAILLLQLRLEATLDRHVRMGRDPAAARHRMVSHLDEADRRKRWRDRVGGRAATTLRRSWTAATLLAPRSMRIRRMSRSGVPGRASCAVSLYMSR